MGLRRREGTDDGAPKAVSAATAALGSQWERGTPGERAARGGRGEGQVDSASFLPVRVRRRSSLGLASAGRTEEDRGVRGERGGKLRLFPAPSTGECACAAVTLDFGRPDEQIIWHEVAGIIRHCAEETRHRPRKPYYL